MSKLSVIWVTETTPIDVPEFHLEGEYVSEDFVVDTWNIQRERIEELEAKLLQLMRGEYE